MAFLTKQELKTKRRQDVIDVITNYEDDTVTEVIDQEIGVFIDALANYDTDVIFSKEGDERHKTILKHIKACVVFELFCIRSSQYDEVLKGQHDEAMNWLEKVSAGKMNTALPLLPDDTTGEHTGFLKLGGRKSYQNKF